jgi:hypothetical protein
MVEIVPDQAREPGFGGSLTILVGGRYLFPIERPPRTVCCKIYATPVGLKHHPTS